MGSRDPIGVALGSIGAGSCVGASLITLGLVVYRSLPASAGGGGSDFDQRFLVITAGLVIGMVAAMATAFALSRTIPDSWRRGVIVASTVFAVTILAALAAPVDLLAGGTGLIVYTALLLAAANHAHNKAKAASRT